MKKSVLAFLAVAAAFSAIAQPVVGTVTDVEGLVTITQNNRMVSASDGATFADGARIVSTATGDITIKVNNCSITLGHNQSLTVDSSLTCDKLRAAVVGIDPVVTAGGGTSIGAGSLGLGAGIIAGGLYLGYRAARDQPISLR